MKKIFTLTIALTAAAVTALAFINEITTTTPAVGTNSAVAAKIVSGGGAVAGDVLRAVINLTGDTGATGTVLLVDIDTTILLSTQLVTGTSATITGVNLATYAPTLILTNATATNLAATAVFTLWQ